MTADNSHYVELRHHLEDAVGLAAGSDLQYLRDRLLDLLDELSFLEAIAHAEATPPSGTLAP